MVRIEKYSKFLAKYEAKLQLKLFKGYLNKSISYFKEEILQILYKY